MQYEEALGDRARIWAEIRRAWNVLTMTVHAESCKHIFCTCYSCYLHGGWCQLIVGYEMKLKYFMKNYKRHFSRERKKQCGKWIETGSKVRFNSVNEFTVSLLECFDERKLSNFSKSEICSGKWQQEESDCVLWFLCFCFLPKIVSILYYFGVTVWKVGRYN